VAVKNILFAIDSPGPKGILNVPKGSGIVDSVTSKQRFTTWVVKHGSNKKLFVTHWYVTIVVRAAAQLDRNASKAGVN
jgi:hypothetical protein